jgi:hypothetical protein
MITAQHNQSLLDIAIQYYGNAQAAVLLAIVNGITVSEELAAGDELKELDQSYELATWQELRSEQAVEEQTLTVQHNQSMLDLAIQYAGSAQAAVFLAMENGRSISEDITIGGELKYTSLPIFSRSIIDNFERNGIVVATGNTKTIRNINIYSYVEDGYVTDNYVE